MADRARSSFLTLYSSFGQSGISAPRQLYHRSKSHRRIKSVCGRRSWHCMQNYVTIGESTLTRIRRITIYDCLLVASPCYINNQGWSSSPARNAFPYWNASSSKKEDEFSMAVSADRTTSCDVVNNDEHADICCYSDNNGEGNEEDLSSSTNISNAKSKKSNGAIICQCQYVDAGGIQCAYRACWRTPTGHGVYCEEHVPCSTYECSRIGMSGRKCANDNCERVAYFAKKQKSRRSRINNDFFLDLMYCRDHRPDESYVNVLSRKCAEPNCMRTCSFGIPMVIRTTITNQPGMGAMAPLMTMMYCKQHIPTIKDFDGVQYQNIFARRCAFPDGCKTIPVFGIRGTKKAEFCKAHVPSSQYINVRAQWCVIPECDKQARWGLPGRRCVSCTRHRTDKMVTTPKKYYSSSSATTVDRCIFCDGIVSDCFMNEQMQQSQILSACSSESIMLCAACAAYQNSNLVHTFRRHRKEAVVRDLLAEKEINFVHDCRVHDGCSKRRPDFQICAPWGSIILEVDEHQHIRRGYSCACEITRMKQIYFDMGVQNLLFIRYNPDAYLPSDERQCISLKKRQTLLIDYIVHLVAQDSLAHCAGFKKEEEEKMDRDATGCFVCYLFYDGHVNRACHPIVEALFDEI